MSHLALGRVKEAEQDFNQVCTLAPKDPDARDKLRQCKQILQEDSRSLLRATRALSGGRSDGLSVGRSVGRSDGWAVGRPVGRSGRRSGVRAVGRSVGRSDRKTWHSRSLCPSSPHGAIARWKSSSSSRARCTHTLTLSRTPWSITPRCPLASLSMCIQWSRGEQGRGGVARRDIGRVGLEAYSHVRHSSRCPHVGVHQPSLAYENQSRP